MSRLTIVMLCIALFASTSAFAQPTDPWRDFVPPPDNEFDWIQLDSGEWLKGRIKMVYSDTIEFDSDKLGLLKFDFADVITLRSSGSKEIKVESDDPEAKVLAGRLKLKDNLVEIEQDGKTLYLGREKLVSIAEDAKSERDYWRGSVTIGANASSGNTENLSLSTDIKIKRDTALTRLTLNYLGIYKESQVGGREYGLTNVTEDNQRLVGSFDWLYTNQFYWQILGVEYYRDPFSNIANQYSFWSGVGYDLISTSRTELSINGGIGDQITYYDSPVEGTDKDSTSPFATIGGNLDQELTDSLDLLYKYQARFLSEESGDYTHHMVTTLSIDLFSDFGIDLSLIWDRIENTTPIEKTDIQGNKMITIPKRDDYQFILGVAYDF